MMTALSRDYKLVLLHLLSAALGLLIITGEPVRAQVEGLRQGFQSPDAASLGEYGDVPVGLYTGTPNIEIPLFTVESKTLKLPVRLTYHSSGIRVNEIAGWVGLGWSLNAGGVITRTVRGLADDDFDGYTGANNTGQQLYESINWPEPPAVLSGSNVGCAGLACSVMNRKADTEPDVFYFNFAGRSGKFVLGPNGAFSIPQSNIRIEQTGSTGTILEWTITLADGTQYIFGNHGSAIAYDGGEKYDAIHGTIENTLQASTYTDQYISAWRLREIRAPGGDVIQFYYEQEKVKSFQEKVSESEGRGGCNVPAYRSVDVHRTIRTSFLSRIETAQQTIRFASSVREDQPFEGSGNRRLEHINILDLHNSAYKTIDFSYDHFTKTGGITERLQLTQVAEVAPGGSPDSLIHRFDYIQGPEGPDLPEYGSFAQDYWGYYNGRDQSTTSLPEIPHIGWKGANRKANPSTVTAGMLKRITYPTGGSTEFTFESNDYSRVGPDPIDAREWTDASVKNDIKSRWGTDIDGPLIQNFTVRGSKTARVKITVYWPFSMGRYYGAPAADIIRDSDGSTVEEIYAAYDSEGNPTREKKVEVYLSPGNYQLRIYGVTVCDDGCDASWYSFTTTRFSAAAEWNEYVDTGMKRRFGGGVRVQKIVDSDGKGENTVRTFNYRQDDDTDRSTGVMVSKPSHYYKVSVPNVCVIEKRHSSSLVPLGAMGGTILGYSKVTVDFGESGQGGSETHRFTTAADYPDTYFLPNTPKSFQWAYTSFDWFRGRNTKEEIRTSEESILKRVTKTSKILPEDLEDYLPAYGYWDQYFTQQPEQVLRTLRGMVLDKVASYEDVRNGTRFDVSIMIAHPYYIVSGWALPDSVESVSLSTSDKSVKISSKKVYKHELNTSSPAFGQLRKQIRMATGSPTRVETYTYAHEKSAYAGMRASESHQLKPLYETRLEDEFGTTLKRSWTTWQKDAACNCWVPHEEYVWLPGQ
jgi:hypothetical protein